MKNNLYIVFLILFSFQASGQSAIVSLDGIQKDFDSRNKVLNLLIESPKIDTSVGIKISNLKLYVNGKDQTKKYHNTNTYYYEASNQYWFGQSQIEVALKKKTNKIDRIVGNIDCFEPTIENKGIMLIKNPTKKFNVDLIPKDNNRIKVILFDFISFYVLKFQDEVKYNSQLAEVSKANQIDKKILQKCFKYFEEQVIEDRDVTKRYFIYCEEIGDKIHDLNLYNTRDKFEYRSLSMNFFDNIKLYVYGFPNGYNNISNLKIKVENKSAVKTYPFEIDNIVIAK